MKKTYAKAFRVRGRKEGSVAKSTNCSCQGHKSKSQFPAPRQLTTPSRVHGPKSPTSADDRTHGHTSKYIHIIKNKSRPQVFKANQLRTDGYSNKETKSGPTDE